MKKLVYIGGYSNGLKIWQSLSEFFLDDVATDTPFINGEPTQEHFREALAEAVREAVYGATVEAADNNDRNIEVYVHMAYENVCHTTVLAYSMDDFIDFEDLGITAENDFVTRMLHWFEEVVIKYLPKVS